MKKQRGNPIKALKRKILKQRITDLAQEQFGELLKKIRFSGPFEEEDLDAGTLRAWKPTETNVQVLITFHRKRRSYENQCNWTNRSWIINIFVVATSVAEDRRLRWLLRTALAIALLGVAWIDAAAQGESAESGTEGVWKTYRFVDGLAGNNVFAIMQDKEGAIWIGTEGGGVSRYDGRGWTTYTQTDGLAHNVVKAILQDQTGAVWVGTGDWLGPGGGISRFDGKNWKTHTPKDGTSHNVAALLQDQDGAIWIGTRDSGVIRYDGKTWTTYTQKERLAHNLVWALCQDKSGAIWVGTGGFGTIGGGVSRFDGAAG
ncbi:hypothetical protein HYR99_21585 [Candidatus Poribacteria bacterium]|nr:hypothetical protein [Candidatus Poribacteria bacterium]